MKEKNYNGVILYGKIMNFTYLEHYIPSILTNLYSFLIGKEIFYGILILAIGILMIFFSRYFKYLFFLFYLLFIFIFIGYYSNLTSKLILSLLVALLIFMPFLYLAFKNGYSMTVINLFMISYLLILFPLIKFYINSYIGISLIVVVIFVIAILTFLLFLSLKRRMFIPEGERL